MSDRKPYKSDLSDERVVAAIRQVLGAVGALADVEDEITRTGQISARLYEQLRTALTDTPLVLQP
ncbi:hypothetical protein ACIQWL_53275 [Streptomyces mirabilis]|uniref:hypothetical protein n=1 Tax=Streptomyces mirabilis TaxID=68239 RepID=UPI00076603C8